jgi:hypothetical protein
VRVCHLLLADELAIDRRLARGDARLVVVLQLLPVVRVAAKVEVVHREVRCGVVGRLGQVVLGRDVRRPRAAARHLRQQIPEEHLVVGMRPPHALLCSRRNASR